MKAHRLGLALLLASAILVLAPHVPEGAPSLRAAPLPFPALDASTHANGQYRACVTNNDDDSQTVYYKTEIQKDYSVSFTVPPAGGYACSSYTTVIAGERTVMVLWTDPDTSQPSTLSQPVPVPSGGTVTSHFIISRNPLWNVHITNHDDDALSVSYAVSTWGDPLTLSVAAGATVSSSSWPAPAGNAFVTVTYTDPDTADASLRQSPAQTLYPGTTTTFSFSIPRNPLWNFSITNLDNDDLTVDYWILYSGEVHSVVVPAGSTVASAWWPESPGMAWLMYAWTDPDKGETFVTNAVEQFLQEDQTATFRTNIPRFSRHTIALSANPPSGGAPTGGGVYDYGTTATVHANPAGDYAFSHWAVGHAVASSLADYSFLVIGDRDLIANYHLKTATPTRTATAGVSKTATPTRTPTPTPSPTQTSVPGQTATATPTPVVSLRLPIILCGN